MANRDGEGIFLRDDGVQMPEKLRIETEEKMEEIHEDLDKFADPEFDGVMPKSVGHYFEAEFEKWLKTLVRRGTEHCEQLITKKCKKCKWP